MKDRVSPDILRMCERRSGGQRLRDVVCSFGEQGPRPTWATWPACCLRGRASVCGTVSGFLHTRCSKFIFHQTETYAPSVRHLHTTLAPPLGHTPQYEGWECRRDGPASKANSRNPHRRVPRHDRQD